MEDDSDDFFMDDNGGLWVYVDEHYDEAEELAEHACPSPPYTQDLANDEDYDRYDIWEDLEYMSDGWYDADTEQGSKRDKRESTTKNNRKSPPLTRKRKAAENSQQGARKRRGNGRITESGVSKEDAQDAKPPILWMSQSERHRGPSVLPSLASQSRPVALLKDWRQTCPPQIPHRKQSPSAGHSRNGDALEQEQIAESARNSSTDLKRDQGSDNEDISEEGNEKGEAIKLDLQSVASMLSKDQLDAIKAQLRGKGLDPSALETVLQDMMEGREPDFEAEDEEDYADEEGDNGEAKEDGEE